MILSQLTATGIGLVGIVVSFWSPLASWGVLLFPLVLLSCIWLIGRPILQQTHAELSPKANEMLTKFGHYYLWPRRCSDYSAAASAIYLCTPIVIVICCCYSFWWAIPIGVVVLFYSGFLSRQFNPTFFLLDDSERRAHEEAKAWVFRQLFSN